jgi:hypothetical protein
MTWGQADSVAEKGLMAQLRALILERIDAPLLGVVGWLNREQANSKSWRD